MAAPTKSIHKKPPLRNVLGSNPDMVAAEKRHEEEGRRSKHERGYQPIQRVTSSTFAGPRKQNAKNQDAIARTKTGERGRGFLQRRRVLSQKHNWQNKRFNFKRCNQQNDIEEVT